MDEKKLKEKFKGKSILVTGGCGSIGSALVKRLLEFEPKVVRIFDNDETRMFEMEHYFTAKFKNIRYFMGNVRDVRRVRRAVEDVDVIFHAAALKHVPLCEYNPFEALQTNVIGTQNIIEAALDENVEAVIAISTDKAANPISTMGATKLLAEKLISDANLYKGRRKTIFANVRFGNVLNTRGSVIPLFLKQIGQGGPVTITDPRMTRFTMSVGEAVNLIMKAACNAAGGEVFVLKMPAYAVGDLAEVVIDEFSTKYGIRKENIKTVVIGQRPGEKKHEELMSEEELNSAWETEDMFIILPTTEILENGPQKDIVASRAYSSAKPTKLKKYSSENVKLLSKDEIRNMLRMEKI